MQDRLFTKIAEEVIDSNGKPALKLLVFARCSLVKVYSDLREQGHDVSFLSV